MSILALSQVSISVIEVVSIDAACFSLWIERSKRAGFEKKSNSFLLLLVLIGIYPKTRIFFLCK